MLAAASAAAARFLEASACEVLDNVDASRPLAVDLVRQLSRHAECQRSAQLGIVEGLPVEGSSGPSVSLAGRPSGRRNRIAQLFVPLGWMTRTSPGVLSPISRRWRCGAYFSTAGVVSLVAIVYPCYPDPVDLMGHRGFGTSMAMAIRGKRGVIIDPVMPRKAVQ